MKRRLVFALLACSAGLLIACGGGANQAESGGDALVRPTLDPSRPTSTPVTLPTPVVKDTPRLRARGVISAVGNDSLTFKDIDGNELTLKRDPGLQFSWDQLKEMQQKRDRITVVYQQQPGGLLLIDVFPT